MRNFLIFIILVLTMGTLSMSVEVYSDYNINLDKIYLIGDKSYETDLKLKKITDKIYQIDEDGNYKVRDSGGRAISFTVKNSKLVDSFNEYYENGKKYIEGKYMEGEKEGIWYTYNTGGSLWKKEEYKNGKLNGEYILYNSSKSGFAEKGTYKSGLKNGEWINYTTDGKKISEGNYANNKKDGLWVEWYTNGNKKSEINYANGLIKGDTTTYYENGNVFYKSLVNGKEVHVESFHRNGNKSLSGELRGSSKIGDWSYYDTKGNLINTRKY